MLNTPIILDTDIGDDPDDTVALAIVARTQPRLALVVTSDERDGARARFARQLLDLLGRPDVPVVSGAQVNHDGRGPWAQRLIDPGVARQPTDVRRAVAEVAGRNGDDGGPVRWVGLGFLTNLAMLWEADPDLATRLAVTQMGGALEWDRPEYNFAGDPRAVRTVLSHGVLPDLVVADLTYQEPARVLPDSALCAALQAAPPGTWQHLVGEHFRIWFGMGKPSFQHDPLAVSAALGEPFVTFDTTGVAVDEAGVLSTAAGGGQARVSLKADYGPFMAWLHRGLGL